MTKSKNKPPKRVAATPNEFAKAPDPTARQQATAFLQTQHFSGPLPPPSILREYDQMMPGLAERLMSLTEIESAHRRELEQKMLDADIFVVKAKASEIFRGQVFGLVIGLAALSIGGYVIVQGHPFAGSILGAGGVAGLVSAFILGRSKAPK